mmetsp:Transcript_145278/g.362348  ORF Transcript_145278/g.362348 Transcript_145278/m.362348 type:complete len:110 (-) Transcript_145278:215-544(-)
MTSPWILKDDTKQNDRQCAKMPRASGRLTCATMLNARSLRCTPAAGPLPTNDGHYKPSHYIRAFLPSTYLYHQHAFRGATCHTLEVPTEDGNEHSLHSRAQKMAGATQI